MRNTRFASTLFAVLLTPPLLAGCAVPLPIIGGGIGGGAVSPDWVIKEAKQYPTFVRNGVSIIEHGGGGDAAPRGRTDVFAGQPNAVLVEHGKATPQAVGDDVFASYIGNQLRLFKGNDVTAEETLPVAFTFRGAKVAKVEIAAKNYLIFVAHSRHTTGMTWLALYDTSGKRYFAGTRPTAWVWNLELKSDGVLFGGPGGNVQVNVSAASVRE